MRLKRYLLLILALLVALNLLVAIGSIGLFERMGPIIARIMKENERSIEASEAMLVVLAEAGGRAADGARRRRFEAALGLARSNITDSAERPVLVRVARLAPAALRGEGGASSMLLDALRELIAINRRAMSTADLEAQRMGRAGAWTAAFLGALSFAFALIMLRRFEQQLVEPLLELSEVVDAAHLGDRHRRCRAMAAPPELSRVLRRVNELLDKASIRR